MPRLRSIGLLLFLATPAAGQRGPGEPFPSLPRELLGLELVESRAATDSMGGMRYVYRDSSQHRADVAIYLPDPPALRLRTDRERLAREARRVRGEFESSRHRGAINSFTVPVDDFHPGDSTSVEMWIQVVVAQERGLVATVFTHIFFAQGRLIRVHLTLPGDEFKTSLLPNFAIDLADSLGARRGPPATRAPATERP